MQRTRERCAAYWISGIVFESLAERNSRRCHRAMSDGGVFYPYLENSRNSLSCRLVLRSAPATDTWKQKQNLSTRTLRRFLRYSSWYIRLSIKINALFKIASINCKNILSIRELLIVKCFWFSDAVITEHQYAATQQQVILFDCLFNDKLSFKI